MANNPYQYLPYTSQPLQAPYNFPPTGFYNLTQYANQQANTNPSTYSVAPIVATYSTAVQRTQTIQSAHPLDLQQAQAGVTVGSATRYYPSTQGGVGMVTSPLQSAKSTANDWHTVGVLRQGSTVWVHDPAYQMNSQTRLPMIPGTSNVTRLLNSTGFGTVNQVQVQGFGSTAQDCMGRSAQFVDNVIGAPGAVAPYPPNTFIAGQVTPGWQVVARY